VTFAARRPFHPFADAHREEVVSCETNFYTPEKTRAMEGEPDCAPEAPQPRRPDAGS